MNSFIIGRSTSFFLVSTINDYVVELDKPTANMILDMVGKSVMQLSDEELFLYKRLSEKGIITSPEIIDPFVYLANSEGLETVGLELTTRCNLKCKHCFVGDERNETLPEDVLEKLVNDAIALGVHSVDITGGEPLVDENLIRKLEYMRRKNLRVTITTNGTLVDESIAKHFKKLGVAKVVVSLNGFKEQHEFLCGEGTYERTIAGVEHLVKASLDVGVNYVIYPGNLSVFPEFGNYCVQLGIKDITVAPVINSGRAREYIELQLPKKRLLEVLLLSDSERRNFSDECGLNCGAATKTIYVRSNGDVLPCKIFFGFSIGNIYDGSLSHIFTGKNEHFLFIQAFDRIALEKCSTEKCGAYTTCQSGCRGRAYLNGDILGVDPESCLKFKGVVE